MAINTRVLDLTSDLLDSIWSNYTVLLPGNKFTNFSWNLHALQEDRKEVCKEPQLLISQKK